MPSEIIVSKGPDKAILEVFAALEEKFGAEHRSINISGVSTADAPESLKTARKATYAIAEMVLNARGRPFSVKFTRNHKGAPYFDVFRIESQQNNSVAPTTEMMVTVDQIIRSKVKVPDNISALSNQELEGVIGKEIADLAALHRNLLDDALTLRTKYEEEELVRRSRFEEDAHAERQRIADHETEVLKALAAKNSELDEKVKEFDLSDHMRARRKQREEITDQIQGFLLKPAGARTSSTKMLIIILICFTGAAFAGLMAYESFQSFISRSESISLNHSLSQSAEGAGPPSATSGSSSSDQLADDLSKLSTAAMPTAGSDYMLWLLALRGAVLSGVAIGFIVYLLAFLRRNHDEELQYHRELQRYGMDINRASWVIETAMEMTSKENASLPDAWVAGACSGLFQSVRANEVEANSLSALGAVLGLGPDVEVGPAGAKLRFSGKAAKSAAKEGAS